MNNWITFTKQFSMCRNMSLIIKTGNAQPLVYTHTWHDIKCQQKISKHFTANVNRINNPFPWSKNVLVTISLSVCSSVPKEALANTSWGQNSRIDALEFRNMEGDRKMGTMNNVDQNMNWYLENLSSSYFPENKSNSQQGLLIVKRHNPFLLFCLNGISPQVFSHKKLWTFGSNVAVAFFKLCLHGSGCISLTLGSVSLCFYSQLCKVALL